MEIYASIVTVIAIVLLIGFIKYRISAYALTYYIATKYTPPTDEECEECAKLVIRHWLGMD